VPAARLVPAIMAAAVLTGCGGDDRRAATTRTATTAQVPPAGTLEFSAVFAQKVPRTLDAGSPVRISGVNVGTVTSVNRLPSATTLGMRIRTLPKWPPRIGAWPVRTDAQIKVYPRLFLEGHYWVALTPGTASAPALRSGSRLLPGQTRVWRSPLR
jgi:hypothetical protein